MGKRLKVKKSTNDPVPVEHPELGGTFWIRPMTFDQGTRYAELVTKDDYDYDHKGNIVFDPDGRPVKKYTGDPREHIDFAIDMLDRISDLEADCVIRDVLVTVDTVCTEGSPQAPDLVERHLSAVCTADPEKGAKAKAGDVLTGHRDSIRDILTLMGTSQVEVEVEVDANGEEIKGKDRSMKVGTKNILRPIHENVFLWVTRESALLAKKRNEVAKGN